MYSRLGLTKLMYSGRIASFIFKREISDYEAQHSVSFTHSDLALLGEFEARCSYNAQDFDPLYAFEFSVIHLVIKFLLS